MSRIGKLPVEIPAGVTVTVSDDNVVTVKGAKYTLSQKIDPRAGVEIDGNTIHVTCKEESNEGHALHGCRRYAGL